MPTSERAEGAADQPGQPLGRVRRLDNGNVELAIGYASIEFTPDHVDALVRQLLRCAHPREHMFVIPVAAGGA